MKSGGCLGDNEHQGGGKWIGFVEKILTGNHGKNTIKYRGFTGKCSHHPIL
jgi:hypothetical protein